MSLTSRTMARVLDALAAELRDGADAGEARAVLAELGVVPAPVTRREVKPDFVHREPKPPRKRKRLRPSRAKADGGGNPATSAEPHEAAGLVDALAERHGTLEAAATALGVRVSTFGLWRSGRISEGALARLRDAATAPQGQRRQFGQKPRQAPEATSAGADEAPAGAGRAADDEAA